MDYITYHGVSIGGNIYSLRTSKRLSQEQLAALLGISPAAVSKWERNLSNPSIEMLWAMADLFQCSIDELVGRAMMQVTKVGIYSEDKLRLAVIGEDLLKCSEISQEKGLLAMETYVPHLKGGSKFLAFAVPYILNLYMKQFDAEEAFQLLENYIDTLPEAQRPEGKMIAAVLRKIFAGASRDILQELIASHIGMEYRERRESMGEILKHSRQEILNSYKDKEMYSEHTNLLENFLHVGNFEIQMILRNTDNATLTAALAGASGPTALVFLSNLADRTLYVMHEDIQRWNGTEEEILTAQKKLLELYREMQPAPGTSDPQ